jgi:hypothetical protein
MATCLTKPAPLLMIVAIATMVAILARERAGDLDVSVTKIYAQRTFTYLSLNCTIVPFFFAMAQAQCGLVKDVVVVTGAKARKSQECVDVVYTKLLY